MLSTITFECESYVEARLFSPLIAPFDDYENVVFNNTEDSLHALRRLHLATDDHPYGIPKSLFLQAPVTVDAMIERIRSLLHIGTAHEIAIHDTRSPKVHDDFVYV